MDRLHTDILPSAQRSLWSELRQLPKSFVLYGGTAIALQLGHRQSVDFDFFCARAFDARALLGDVAFLRDAQIVNQAPNTLTCRVLRATEVMVSFMTTPNLRQIRSPVLAADNGCRVASLIDLAGTKASVVQQRAEAKDYIDMDALLVSGIGLHDALAAATLIFGASFDPQSTLKALSYYGDGDLPSLAKDIRQRLSQAVKAVDLDRLPVLAHETNEIGA